MTCIRTATEQDGQAIAAIYDPYVRDTAISFEEVAPTPSEMSERIRTTLPTHPFLVFQEADAVIAYAYASRHRDRAAYRWSVDVAIYVAPAGRHSSWSSLHSDCRATGSWCPSTRDWSSALCPIAWNSRAPRLTLSLRRHHPT
jgi:L-amino acid N-acyltransferase YncA